MTAVYPLQPVAELRDNINNIGSLTGWPLVLAIIWIILVVIWVVRKMK